MKNAQWALYHVARLALALVFVYAGAVKMQDVVTFAGHVAAYQILPYALNYLVAATLPYIEFLAGLMLLLNVRVRPALVAVCGMTLVFMAALVSVLARGLEIDCGCFDPGGGQDVTAAAALLRDIGLVALMMLVWWLRSRITVRDAEPPG
jgi:uncharacterized membrane protein YphA (DoxX/SURF4 family)